MLIMKDFVFNFCLGSGTEVSLHVEGTLPEVFIFLLLELLEKPQK